MAASKQARIQSLLSNAPTATPRAGHFKCWSARVGQAGRGIQKIATASSGLLISWAMAAVSRPAVAASLRRKASSARSCFVMSRTMAGFPQRPSGCATMIRAH